MLIVTPDIKIPLWELTFTFSRSSGPGGQNVNKVNSKATLRWSLATSPSLPPRVRERFRELFPTRVTEDGEVVLTSDRFRDQGMNVEDCMEKLRELLLAASREPKKRKKTKPTRSSREKRLKSKSRHSEKKKLRRSFD